MAEAQLKNIRLNLEQPHAKITEKVQQLAQLRNLPEEPAAKKQSIRDISIAHDQLSLYYERVETQLDRLNDLAVEYPEDVDVEALLRSVTKLLSHAGDHIKDAENWIKYAVESLPQPIVSTPAVSTRMQSTTQYTKLPKQELPKFEGNKEHWIEFWQSFEAQVHNNPNLQAIQKMNYLLPLLLKEAKSAVAGLPASNDNYPIAISILKERFGNQSNLIRSYYNRLNQLQPCEDNHKQLRKFLDEVQCITRSLNAVGHKVVDQQLEYIVFNKLPTAVVKNMERAKPQGQVWTEEKIIEALTVEVTAGETASERLEQEAKKHETYQFSDENGSGDTLGTGNALIAHQRNSRKLFSKPSPSTNYPRSYQARPNPGPRAGPVRVCNLCNSINHTAVECSRYSTHEARSKRVRELNLCLNCLKPGHQCRECRSNFSCRECKRRHHTSLCFDVKNSQSLKAPAGNVLWSREVNCQSVGEDQTSSHKPATDPEPSITALKSVASPQKQVVLLQSASALVSYGNKQVKVRLLLDSCSNRTYITDKVASALSVPRLKQQSLSINVFGSTHATSVPAHAATVNLKLKDGSLLSMEATVLSSITGSYRRDAIDCADLKRYQDELIFADTLPDKTEIGDVDVLVGNDYYLDIVTGQRMEVQPGLYILGSKLGWIVTGRACSSCSNNDHNVTAFALTCQAETMQPDFICNAVPFVADHPPVEDLWNLDVIGINDNPEDDDDVQARTDFRNSIQVVNGRYYVGFPWIKEKVDQLPTNRDIALRRLKMLMNRLSVKPELLKQYDQIMKDQLSREVTEIVDTSKQPQTPEHYIAHREVVRPDRETTKVRVVFDASCRVSRDALSLNDCLRRGPVFLQSLCGILLRFRLNKIAFVADLERAFHQVGLREEDRDATRFLWPKHINQPVDESNLVVMRFQRVLFGTKPSPFMLEGIVDHHLTIENTDISRKINENVYMDNLAHGVDTISEAKQFYKETKHLFQKASMNMREWASNSKEFLHVIPEDDRTKPEIVKVLGVMWNVNTDTLQFRLSDKLKPSDVMSKRDLVSAAAAVFDPIGLLLPLTLAGKVLLQEAIRKVKDWNASVDEKYVHQWKKFVLQLQEVKNLAIPRYIDNSSRVDGATAQLHCFTDASDRCYAAAVYIRLESKESVSVNLVFAKGRVNPVKKMTIPRLELMGILIGVRALKFVEKHLGRKGQKFLWSDSMVALQWLRSARNLGTFVNNRVAEIQKSEDVEFRYVDTKLNPADIPTREPRSIEVEGTWLKGPAFLALDQSSWPGNKFPENTKEVSEDTLKHKEGKRGFTNVSQETPSLNSPFGIDISKFSSFGKLTRVTAHCSRFIDKLQKKPTEKGQLTPEELTRARTMWVLHEQSTVKIPCRVKLGLFQDEVGVWRCKGRFANAQMRFETKHPIFIPDFSQFARLLILYAHQQVFHAGPGRTLAKLREAFWIPKGKSRVRSVLLKCVTCRKFEGSPFKRPPMAALPSSRVTQVAAFTRSGVDYFGPLFVKAFKDKAVRKVWVAIFVCLTTRAVHMELVSDMTTASFLLALRRFAAVRGKPAYLLSDNGSQFVAADEFLQQLCNKLSTDPRTLEFCSSNEIAWHRITEFAPWEGGAYERLIKTVKEPLRKTLGQIRFTKDQLSTILQEIAAMINSRPLIPAQVTDESFPEILTPNHFLMANKTSGFTMQIDDQDEETKSASSLLEKWLKGQRILQDAWKVWQEEYLTSLRESHRMFHSDPHTAVDQPAREGEIVVIHDNNVPRSRWKLGKVIELKGGRAAKVRVPNGNTLWRPVNLLYPLEVQQEAKI